MDLLLKSDCPLYKLSGLGGLELFQFGAVIAHSVDLCHFSCFLAQLSHPASRDNFLLTNMSVC